MPENPEFCRRGNEMRLKLASGFSLGSSTAFSAAFLRALGVLGFVSMDSDVICDIDLIDHWNRS
ncbi:MAG: hypothetical protein ACRD25_02955 [Terracidiphilus sp.]